MSAGDEEKKILLGINEMVKEFSRQGKNSTPKVYEGYHEWHVWRKSFKDFAQMLFTWDDAELDDINKAVPVRLKNIDSTHRYRRMRAWYFLIRCTGRYSSKMTRMENRLANIRMSYMVSV